MPTTQYSYNNSLLTYLWMPFHKNIYDKKMYLYLSYFYNSWHHSSEESPVISIPTDIFYM